MNAECQKICEKLKVPDSQYKEFEKGFSVEQEHKDVVKSEEGIGQMVLEHLKEDPKYYTKLSVMLNKSK